VEVRALVDVDPFGVQKTPRALRPRHGQRRPTKARRYLRTGTAAAARSFQVLPGATSPCQIASQNRTRFNAPSVAVWTTAFGGVAAPQREETNLAPALPGVTWETNYATALSRSAAENKPLLVLMTRPNCPNTALLAEQVLASPEMLTVLSQQVVPLVQSIDTINTTDVSSRGGKPTLTGETLAENNQRLTLESHDCLSFCIMAALYGDYWIWFDSFQETALAALSGV